MHLPTDIATWLKIVGDLSAGTGSLLLAWRIKAILKWVVYCLVAHEQSIEQLAELTDNRKQNEPIVKGVTKHLLDVKSKLGVVLLVAGFILLGIGMFSNAASFFVGSGK